MTLVAVGFLLLIFLSLPPVAHVLESHMVLHMHMQMPLLVIAGILMAPFFQRRLPRLFERWNSNGIPGVLMFTVISIYWTLPRTMDEALTFHGMELFKFAGLPFLAGVPIKDSWGKLKLSGKKAIYLFYAVLCFLMGYLYLFSPIQLCNRYLLIEQITLGWAFLLTALGLVVLLIYVTLVDPRKYE